MDDVGLANIDRIVDDYHTAAGVVLTREGGVGRQSFVIVSGVAAVTVRGQQVASLGAGAVFGEMAVLQNAPRSPTVTALTAMHLLVVSRASLAPLLLTEGVTRKVLVDLSERLRAADARIGAPSGAPSRT